MRTATRRLRQNTMTTVRFDEKSIGPHHHDDDDDDDDRSIIEEHRTHVVVPAHLLWYSQDDYHRFRRNDKDDNDDDDDGTIEEATVETKSAPPGNSTNKKNDYDDDDSIPSSPSSRRREFVLHLLDLQSEQRALGMSSDPKGLQVVSRACSKTSKAHAYERALQLARDVGSSTSTSSFLKSSSPSSLATVSAAPNLNMTSTYYQRHPKSRPRRGVAAAATTTTTATSIMSPVTSDGGPKRELWSCRGGQRGGLLTSPSA